MIDELRDKKILVIVESPSKATHIKDYLRKEGYQVNVMASVGHIMEVANGGTYHNSGIEPTKDFELNLKVSDDKYKVVEQLKTQAKTADLVYLMSDPDREGEVISWSLVKFLKLPKAKIRRAVTHEITPKAVVKAIENPIPIDNNLVDAGLARMTLDKMLGFVASPIAKTYVGAKSVGRCQSVGLKLVVDREKEIQNFVPETYFDLYVNFEKNKTKFKAKYIGTDDKPVEKIRTKEELDLIKSKCTGKYTVQSIVEKTQKESPALPYITATLQQDIASKLGLKVKDIMSICQTLFEKGFISYHRSDSPVLAREFVEVAKKYIESNYDNLYSGPKEYKKKESEQDGHEAIRCTDVTLCPKISGSKITNDLHKKVYDLIWRRTMQSLAIPAEYAVQKIIITNNGQNFEFEQKLLKEPGFKKIN